MMEKIRKIQNTMCKNCRILKYSKMCEKCKKKFDEMIKIKISITKNKERSKGIIRDSNGIKRDCDGIAIDPTDEAHDYLNKIIQKECSRYD